MSLGLTNHSGMQGVSGAKEFQGSEGRTRRSGSETSDVVRPQSLDPPSGGSGLRRFEDLTKVAVGEHRVENERRLRAEFRISNPPSQERQRKRTFSSAMNFQAALSPSALLAP